MKSTVIVLSVLFTSLFIGCAQRMEIDPDNHGPVMIHSVEPVYPADAARRGIEGVVWIKMWVTERGNVTKAMVEKTDDPALTNAAMDAAMKTKFSPSKLEGKAIGVWLIAPFPVKRNK